MPTFGIALFLALCLQLTSSSEPKRITRSQARDLLLRVLEKKGYPVTAKNFELDDTNDSYYPDFYSFQSYSNSESRLVSTGVFAVNNRTADVWDALPCRRLELRMIKPVQKELRKQIGLSDQAYAQLTKEAPCHVN